MSLRALLVFLILAFPVAPSAEEEQVEMSLQNRAGIALRCQFLLAHWMTSKSWEVAPGEDLTLELGRGEDGTLFQSHPDEPRPFPVEALVCGENAAFDKTRLTLDLSDLRLGLTSSLTFLCEVPRDPTCRAKAP